MNPFDALGLSATELTDEEERSAWRDIAAATHPDRPDGGDPAAYAAATAAYTQLRTPWGRTEALAESLRPTRQLSWPQSPPPHRPALPAAHGLH